MRTCPRIAVHPSIDLEEAERAARAIGCDLILEDGRAYLVPREAFEPSHLKTHPFECKQRSSPDAR